MIVALALLVGFGTALPHFLRLERSAPAAAATLWAVSLALRALGAMFVVLYIAFFLPGTRAFNAVTHWCWHTVLPVVTAQLGLDGHNVGDAATILPGLIVMVSLLSVTFGVVRAARAVRRLLRRDAIGPGPADSVIVPGSDVVLAAAGLTHPRVVVSAGALLALDDEELAAGLDHEHGHIARRHRFLLVFAELCRGIGRAIPGSRRALRELAFHLERDADQWALGRLHDRLALASAICKSAGAELAGAEPTATIAAAPLAGVGTGERLTQLIHGPPANSSRRRAAILNAAAIAMVMVTVVTAALVPSTALAGASHVGHDHQLRHCEE